MINTIFIITFVSLAAISFLAFLFLVYKNFKFVNNKDNELEVGEDYNAILYFFHTADSLIKFVIKKIIRGYRFILHYCVLFGLKVLDWTQAFIEKRYQSARNRFVNKSVENRAFVVHFWDHLKHYKREIDKEEKDLEKK